MSTEFSDDEMVDLLRGTAQVLPGTRPEHVAAAGMAGRKLRRRRRAATVIGTGTAGLAMVVGVTALGLNTGNATQTVVQPAAPTGTSPSPKPSKSDDELTPAEKEKAKASGMSPEEFAATAPGHAAQQANVQLLLDTLGSDFRLREDGAPESQVMVRAGSAAAAALPKGWLGGANFGMFKEGESGLTLSQMCKPGQEKGTGQEACKAVDLANGRTVYVQKYSFSTGQDSPSTTQGVRFYYGRPDGLIVRVMLEDWTMGSAGQSTRDTAAAWLSRYTDALTSLTADARISPKPTTTGQTPDAPVITSHDRDLVVMQRALGIDFEVLDGKLSLEPNWPLYKKLPTLPHGNWQVDGDVTSITRSAFEAACSPKAGTTGCEQRTVDGHDVYVRTWADQDAKQEFVGESAVYFIRPDGRVLLANLELTSDQLNPTASSAKVAGVKAWLQALEADLIKAVTDPELKG